MDIPWPFFIRPNINLQPLKTSFLIDFDLRIDFLMARSSWI